MARRCKLAIEEYNRVAETKLVDDSNLGKFYRYCNSKFSCRKNVSFLKQDDGKLTTDQQAKADLLNRHFSNVYTEDNGTHAGLPSPKSGNALSSVTFSEAKILSILKRLKRKSAGGPDGIPAVFYKECAHNLVNPLTRLFQIGFDHSYLPNIWKFAFVTAVHKKGDVTLVSNYRPISLTCTMCKIMERVINDSMLRYLSSCNLISKRQHGFLSKHSTSTNLLESSYDWTLALDSRKPVDIVYIDFSRAFDSVVHSKLLYKLNSIGITDKLLSWISSFLSDRTQCTVVEGYRSSITKVISGVVQGSCIGPVLFVIFVNDVTGIFDHSSMCSMYADDIKIYTVLNIDLHTFDLSHDLARLNQWANLWQLKINPSKCQTLHLGLKNPALVYDIGDTGIESAAEVKDLGVTIDSKLKYITHIHTVVAKGFQRLALIRRGFVSRNRVLLVKAYITYVRPVLEYSTHVWSPVYKTHVDLIERVQRRFTRMLDGLHDLSYPDRLAATGLESLELRRLRSDLCMYYKIINGQTCLSADEYFKFDCSVKLTRTSCNLKLVKPRYNTDLLKHNFFCTRHIRLEQPSHSCAGSKIL